MLFQKEFHNNSDEILFLLQKAVGRGILPEFSMAFWRISLGKPDGLISK